MTIPKQKTAWCFDCASQQGYKVYACHDVLKVGNRYVAAPKYVAKCAKCGRGVEVEWVEALNYKSQVEAKDYAKRCGAKEDGDRT